MKLFSRVNVSFVFFTIIGAMNGAIISLLASFFLDFLLTSYSTTCPLTYIDFLCVTTPCFSIIGAIFHMASAIFLYDENVEKPKKRFLKRKK